MAQLQVQPGLAVVRLRDRCIVSRAREKNDDHWHEMTTRVARRTEIFRKMRVAVMTYVGLALQNGGKVFRAVPGVFEGR